MTTSALHYKVAFLYGEDRADDIVARLLDLLPDNNLSPVSSHLPVSEQDVILITYGDMVKSEGEAPLATQHRFLKARVRDIINTVHILPFYPYTSDDGFSVVDYYAVNPDVGDWDDVQAMGQDFQLMFDAVLNHISSQSEWFQAFLRGEAPYTDYFVKVDPSTDLSAVVRPRALPLLTPVQTSEGEQHVWTTFSDDQIDLNIMNPDVLIEMMKILLFYVEQGAKFIRLDAIAFLWKEIGTSSIHLPQTHTVIQIMRELLNQVAPDVVLITETNVPHKENISYFGDGKNEAQMVYQFPLPPLVLHTLTIGNVNALTQWATSLKPVGESTTFFNFTSSHDGIGVRPVEQMLTSEEVGRLVELAQVHGGYVSYKNNPDGTQSPYELNITYFDAITHPDITAQNPDLAVKRFMVSQGVALALAGVPGIYFHCLFGSQNYHAGVKQTGRYRSINRQKVNIESLNQALRDLDSLQAKVFAEYAKLLDIRTQEPAFHPLAKQEILNLHPSVFAVKRISQDESGTIHALFNVTGEVVQVEIGSATGIDLLTGMDYSESSLQLQPYQILWLKKL